MLESGMYATLIKLLPSIHWQRIESSTGVGIPDITYATRRITGRMETKDIAAMPKRASTNIKIPWRPGQLSWYRKYRAKTECPYILCLTIGDEWYFITAIKEEYTQQELDLYHISTTKNLKDFRSKIKGIMEKMFNE